MHVSSGGISLPVSIVSGKGARPATHYKTVTETFSTEFRQLLPNTVLLELGVVFNNSNGMSWSQIRLVNEGIRLLCKYMVNNKLNTLSAITYWHLVKVLDFIKQETRPYKNWRDIYYSLKSYSSDTVLWRLSWPRVPSEFGERPEGKTQGHSMHAYLAIGNALRSEIDTIRGKKGRLADAQQKGKVLTLEDLDFVHQSNGFKQNKLHNGDGLWVTREDVICTILHYLPGWPFINRYRSQLISWGVYKELQGIRLGSFESKEEAEALAAEHGGDVIVIEGSYKRTEKNPAELILACISSPSVFSPAASHLRSLFNDNFEIISIYFPTAYDWLCIFFYWSWLTGWNVETIGSVVASDLGFGIDIAKHCPMELFTGDHIEILGRTPTNETNTSRRESVYVAKQGDAEVVITGEKTRSQPEDKPKPYSYISHKDEPYDLYSVLKDFYELTEPIRPYLYGDEKNCILVGVAKSSANKHNLSIFGGQLKSLPPNHKSVRVFFKRNPIYEDEREHLGSSEPYNLASNSTSTPNKSERVWETNTRKMRTTYESWLQESGVPITERQMMMGHERASTTMTSYGAEQVSVGIRIRNLRRLLNEVEKQVFQGQLQRFEQRDSATYKSKNNNVVQIFSHLLSDVLICQNSMEPTWTGHEEYVNGNCTEFDECLFCKQCLITPDTEPGLWTYISPFSPSRWVAEQLFCFYFDLLLRGLCLVQRMFILKRPFLRSEVTIPRQSRGNYDCCPLEGADRNRFKSQNPTIFHNRRVFKSFILPELKTLGVRARGGGLLTGNLIT